MPDRLYIFREDGALDEVHSIVLGTSPWEYAAALASRNRDDGAGRVYAVGLEGESQTAVTIGGPLTVYTGEQIIGKAAKLRQDAASGDALPNP